MVSTPVHFHHMVPASLSSEGLQHDLDYHDTAEIAVAFAKVSAASSMRALVAKCPSAHAHEAEMQLSASHSALTLGEMALHPLASPLVMSV